MMPYAPIATSPPYSRSDLFTTITTAEAQRCSRNEAIPIEKILPTTDACKRKIPRSNRMKLPREEKWMSETERAATWASTVAAAEPRIPQPNPKMNSGLSRQFNTTAVSIIVMALLG